MLIKNGMPKKRNQATVIHIEDLEATERDGVLRLSLFMRDQSPALVVVPGVPRQDIRFELDITK